VPESDTAKKMCSYHAANQAEREEEVDFLSSAAKEFAEQPGTKNF
jgi:hypothetical protein